jgi:hypothetical protein
VPYVKDKGYVLSPEQDALRLAMIEAARPLKEAKVPYKDATGPWFNNGGYLLGTLVVPAHPLEGRTLNVPERHHNVYYQPGWGITVHQGLGTDNGNV